MKIQNNAGIKTSELHLTVGYVSAVFLLTVVAFERGWVVEDLISILKVITPVVLAYGIGRPALKGIETFKAKP